MMRIGSEELERKILSFAMNDEKILTEMLVGKIQPNDFQDEIHKTIFATMTKRLEDGNQINDMMISLDMDRSMRPTVLEISKEYSFSLNHAPFISELKNRAWAERAKNGLQSIYAEINSRANLRGREAITGRIITVLEDILKDDYAPSLVSAREVIDRTIEEIAKTVELAANGEIMGLRTGIPQLDEHMYGWRPGMFYVIGARPGMGKTTLGLNFLDWGIKQGKHIVLYSLESRVEENGKKLIASGGRVKLKNIMTGNLTDPDMDRIMQASRTLSAGKFSINDNAATTLETLKAECRMLKMKGELDAVFIDYLTLLYSFERKFESFQKMMAHVTKSLKELSKSLMVPVIALAQLKRDIDTQRKTREPVLSDLKESGSIEQDADAVIFIDRPYMYDKSKDPREAWLHLEKNRFGEIGKVPLDAALDISSFLPKQKF